MRRITLLSVVALLAACASQSPTDLPSSATQGPTPPGQTASQSTQAPSASTSAAAQPPLSSLSSTPGASASAQPTTSAGPLKTGWPSVRRSGVTMRAEVVDDPPPFDGSPAPGPTVALEVTISGLDPGEAIVLGGRGAYAFATLGCGIVPASCQWGSDTTDPAVHLCRPAYSHAVEGTTNVTAEAVADAAGTARATVRFLIPEAERACPAGASLPWFVEAGEWKLRVTDRAHGLRLVGPPDLVVGP
jgi:hypothetical protein